MTHMLPRWCSAAAPAANPKKSPDAVTASRRKSGWIGSPDLSSAPAAQDAGTSQSPRAARAVNETSARAREPANATSTCRESGRAATRRPTGSSIARNPRRTTAPIAQPAMTSVGKWTPRTTLDAPMRKIRATAKAENHQRRASMAISPQSAIDP